MWMLRRQRTSAPFQNGKGSQKDQPPPVIGSILGVIVGVPVLQRAFFGGGIATPDGSLANAQGWLLANRDSRTRCGSLVSQTTAATTTAAMTATGTNGAALPSPRRRLRSRPVAHFHFPFSLNATSFSRSSNLSSVPVSGTGRTRRAVVSFVLLMEGCMPPAQNSVIMLEGLKGTSQYTMAKLLTLACIRWPSFP
jgi:hypothetical protein